MTLEKDHSMTFQKDDNSAESPSNDKRNKNDTEEEEEEEEEDTVVSAPEILALQRELEMEAARLYPGKFDKCTYDRGTLFSMTPMLFPTLPRIHQSTNIWLSDMLWHGREG